MNIVINDNIANCYATETRPGKVDFTLGAADCDWFHDLFFPIWRTLKKALKLLAVFFASKTCMVMVGEAS